MEPRAYYNENNEFAAAWLRNLIQAGVIAKGEVDERSIEDVQPSDLRGFTQCHFFAGIGVWSYALRCAGWPDSRPVWTGSCPCQPFSTAGKRKGTADERHLWPSWFHLIQQHKPPTIFGEQVKAAIKQGWLDLVQDDLEGIGYTCGAVAFPACSLGAPHIRQRLYFVAGARSEKSGRLPSFQREEIYPSGSASEIIGLADSRSQRRQQIGRSTFSHEAENGSARWDGGEPNSDYQLASDREIIGVASSKPSGCYSYLQCNDGRVFNSIGTSEAGVVGVAHDAGLQRFFLSGNSADKRIAGTPSLVNGFWRCAEWLYCRDEKYRPVEPGTSPLAHGSPNRVGRLRGYGNAIVAPQAQAFIESFLETENA